MKQRRLDIMQQISGGAGLDDVLKNQILEAAAVIKKERDAQPK